MILVTIILALALFSLVSLALGIEDDPGRGRTPEEALFLVRHSHH